MTERTDRLAPTEDGATLFELPEANVAKAPTAESSESVAPWAKHDAKHLVRLREANRSQMVWGRIDLDAQLPEDHAARAIWAVVGRLDLSALYEQIDARGALAGASAIDPKILLTLWIYATSEGEASAREIWRLTQVHAAYRWICGGVDVGYHTLSDFRSQQSKVIDALITQVLAVLMEQGLVDLSRTAQDGTRVRASAGAASFRRQRTLQELMQEAREHLDAVTREASDPAISTRRAAARKRGAEQRLQRLEEAMAQIPQVAEVKKRQGKDAEPRVSTTDPDARVMKMGDGGFRPAFNVQLGTTTDGARVIVGVDVTNSGSDANLSTPMLEQIEQRTGVRPAQHLVDGGYAQHDAIDKAADQDVTLYAPVPKPRNPDSSKAPPAVEPDPFQPRPTDSEAVAEWRKRMGTDDAKQIYKQRAATAETVNADAKAHRGLDHFCVRGLNKVLGAASLFALTYDILRLIALGG